MLDDAEDERAIQPDRQVRVVGGVRREDRVAIGEDEDKGECDEVGRDVREDEGDVGELEER